MNIKELDMIEKQIKPIISDFIKNTDKLDFLPFASDLYCEAESICFNCKYSLGFYDDVDVICACGFAGNEHLCPIIQNRLNIKIKNYCDAKKRILQIITGEEDKCK